MPSEERDRQFERALQRHLRADAREAACPDAETLAAYHERTLGLEELTKWKEHVANCMRCQETLALLERTAAVGREERQEQGVAYQGTLLAAAAPNPAARLREKRSEAVALGEESPGDHGLERSPGPKSWRWVGALGVLAAGLILFVAVRENRRASVETAKSQMARNMAVPAPAAPPPTAEQLSKSADDAARPTKAFRDLENSYRIERSVVNPQTAGSPAQAKPRAGKPSPAVPQAMDNFSSVYVNPKGTDAGAHAKQAQATRGGAAQNPGQGFGNAPLPQQAPAARAPAANASTGDNITSKESAEELPNENAQTRSTSQSVAGEAGAVSKKSRDAQAAKLSSQLEAAGNGRLLTRVAQSNPHIIVAPMGTHAWRVGAAGLIEATSDAGLNWKPQDSRVRVDLSAGSAPTDKVCWVVGRAGTILLTDDGGEHWKQVTSPLIEDLGGVHALDGKHASIWNIGNRKSLETADGGLTWTPAANE